MTLTSSIRDVSLSVTPKCHAIHVAFSQVPRCVTLESSSSSMVRRVKLPVGLAASTREQTWQDFISADPLLRHDDEFVEILVISHSLPSLGTSETYDPDCQLYMAYQTHHPDLMNPLKTPHRNSLSLSGARQSNHIPQALIIGRMCGVFGFASADRGDRVKNISVIPSFRQPMPR